MKPLTKDLLLGIFMSILVSFILFVAFTWRFHSFEIGLFVGISFLISFILYLLALYFILKNKGYD